ncbi:MAG: hypothetical protein H6Q16_2048 [Bacteroidetes bacterium]|nr:hypothetical protein [Bacteroidota bacterium]
MKKYLLLTLAILVFASCKPTKENRLKEIGELEKLTLKEAKVISPQRADSLLVMYDSYITDFPKDSNSTLILFKAADICINMKYCDRAIAYLERLVSDFPDSKMSEIANFKIGEAYEKACNNIDKAKEAYKTFVEEYPNSPLANDAEVMYQMLDMPDEMEIIRQFEAKNAETLTTEK